MSGAESNGLPATYDADRLEVQRLAVHVLARARHQAVGRFGLVATPGGVGTPAFGPDATVVRLSGPALLVERGGDVTATPLAGATLRALAEVAGADLAVDLSVGHDTPPPGDLDGPIAIDPASVAAIGRWLALGTAAIDEVVAGLGAATSPARTQVWPEHFDAGTNVAVGPGADDRVNLGASTGDGFHAAPYLYVGPWSADRPGDAAYWNAPFGAVLGWDDVAGALDPAATAVAFLREGLARFA